MGKPHDLSRRCWWAKPRSDTYYFDKGQLLDLENDNVGKVNNTEDIELQQIGQAAQEKNNGLWVVLQEHRLEVLCQHHESQVVGH